MSSNRNMKKMLFYYVYRFYHPVKVEGIQLLDYTDIVRRLKRTNPFKLV